MITQKYNKQFTDSELNTYLSTISNIQGGQSAQVDEAWRTLGYINASAFKGYGALSDDHAAYNGMVYRTKEKAIIILASHTDNIAAFGGVLYIRTLDGIQISFHLGSHSSSMLRLLHEQYQAKVEWDGVQNSYTYTDINAYNEARAEYQRKRQEDADKRKYIDSLIHAEVQKFFAHHATRKSFGLPAKKKEWEAYCEEAMTKCSWAHDVWSIIIGCYGIRVSADIHRVALTINAALPEGWNKYNFND